MLLNELRECHRPRQAQQLPSHSPDLLAKFRWPPRRVTMPEWHFPRLARRRRNQHAIVRNVFDPPRAGAKNDRVPGAAFENHFLVEFANTRAFRGAGKKYAVKSAIRNRSAVNYSNPPRALAAGELISDTIPCQPRT